MGGFTADSKTSGAGFGGAPNNGESNSSTAQVGNVRRPTGRGAEGGPRSGQLKGTNVKSQGDVT